jgi:hypothetical protein
MKLSGAIGSSPNIVLWEKKGPVGDNFTFFKDSCSSLAKMKLSLAKNEHFSYAAMMIELYQKIYITCHE